MELEYEIVGKSENQIYGQPTDYKFMVELRGRTFDGGLMSIEPSALGVSRDVFQHFTVGDRIQLTIENA